MPSRCVLSVKLRRPPAAIRSKAAIRRSARGLAIHRNFVHVRPLTPYSLVLTIAMPSARATRAKLATYLSKRDFTKTCEPPGKKAVKPTGHSYLIQKHAASRLHYDFRLELDGVLKSGRSQRGQASIPATNVSQYTSKIIRSITDRSKGRIPQGQYGGGTVMLWDHGTWEPLGDPERDLKRGNLTFRLHGKRLKGRWHLVRLRGNGQGDTKRQNWLLIKGKDEYANTDGDAAIQKYQKSVASHRSMEGIAKGSGQSWDKRGARKRTAAEAADAVKALRKKAQGPGTRVTAPMPKLKRGRKLAEFITPQLATLVAAPPHGDNWVHEIKFDGYRLVAVLNRNHVQRLHTRR